MTLRKKNIDNGITYNPQCEQTRERERELLNQRR